MERTKATVAAQKEKDVAVLNASREKEVQLTNAQRDLDVANLGVQTAEAEEGHHPGW